VQIGDYWAQFVDELSTRGAISALFSAIVFLSLVLWWFIRNHRLLKQIQSVPIRILVTGSRGKSTVVRLIHATLTANGIRTYAKTTGTAACELDVAGNEYETRRIGQVSILEILETAKRAFKPDAKPEAMVIECMAVSPLLTKILSEFMFKPHTVIITNALLDHLEEQGKTREEIANSLFSAVSTQTKSVITADPYPTNLVVYEKLSKQSGVDLRITSGDSISSIIKNELSTQHPANIALSLQISDEMNLEEKLSVDGMKIATREPYDRELRRLSLDSKHVTFYDLGSINDTDSLPANVETVLREKTEERVLIALLVNRWDRPLRALEFTANLLPSVFDGVILVGEPFVPCRNILLENGFTRFQILRLNSLDRFNDQWQRYILDFSNALKPNFEEAVIVLLENIHDPLADVIREVSHNGNT
jgi:gamma-polyglutamate synthase